MGVPIANRHRVETEALVGFFVNTQVLRTVIEPQASLRAVLGQVKSAALGAQEHQDLSFEMLVEALVDAVSPDQRVSVAEGELLRTVCAVLHCPLPAMLERA